PTCQLKSQPFTLGVMNIGLPYAAIPKIRWHRLAPDELGAVMADLATLELQSTQLAVRGRIRRRRLEAVALFRRLHGQLSEKWMWVPKYVRTPRYPDEPIRFRNRPMWH